jgi:homoserine kinase
MDNLVYQAATRYLRELGSGAISFSITCHNDIPLSRGLGSSSAAIVGGVLGASVLMGEKEPNMEALLRVAVDIEGHPDNVVAALFGGCQIVVEEEGVLLHQAIPLARDFSAVLFIPDIPMPTVESRSVLPEQIPMDDAVYNLGRVALLVNSLKTGETDFLRVATKDRLHQPAREKIFPPMPLLLRSAVNAGAFGAFLSGAGPTILALTYSKELTVAYEIADTADKLGISGEIKVTKVSSRGAHISEE